MGHIVQGRDNKLLQRLTHTTALTHDVMPRQG
jgi:hypothetical protein